MNKNSYNIYIIIVAAGIGSRFDSALPKQYCLLNGIPVVMHTINRLRAFVPDGKIILVISREMHSLWNELCGEFRFSSPDIVYGGKNRTESVRNALDSIEDNDGVVLIHDGVRPLIDRNTVSNVINAVVDGVGVAPAVDVTDSLRKILHDNTSISVNRSEYKRVQTPQGFILNQIREAYSRPPENVTDDLSVWENCGGKTVLVDGSSKNIKITYPEDIALASILLK